jgi:AAA family ATP:ADP antiporter
VSNQIEGPTAEGVPLTRLLQRIVDVKPDEVRALLWSCLYFFCVLSAYYIIRPVRDDMGVAGGVRNLPWLFTGTLAGMLICNPPYAALVAKLSRLRFVSITYRFFMANIVIFFLLLRVADEAQYIWIGRFFFIWTSVFNLFVVSVFWAFMADLFTNAQGKRLFGFIGAGGTLGGIVGSGFTAFLAQRLGPTMLLWGSIVLLEIAVLCVRRLSRLSEGFREGRRTEASARPIGGKVMAGMTHVFKSSYLLGICGYMLLYTIAATFLYFEQADIVDRNFVDRAVRTAFFARIDLLTNVLTLGTQLFLTGRILRILGVGLTLTLLPALCVIGFGTVGMMPTLAVIMIFQTLRRAGNFAVARPTREVLYTVVEREDRFKAKSFIDTFVYRAGDQVGAWSYALMGAIGLSMVGIAWVAVPMSAVWLVLALWLGRRQEALTLLPSIRSSRESPALPISIQ